jgi:two-component system, response regulator RegA
MTQTHAPLLLLVEDDVLLRERLARAFAARGFDVRQAADIETAEAAAAAEVPEFVVLDLRMPGGHGLDLIPDLLAADPATKIVVLTGYGSVATAVEAVRMGAVHYLTKPADADEILAAFARAPDAGRAAADPLQPMTLDRVEWEHINRVLVDCGHNVSEAARVLGLHRRSLQRKLARYPPRR